MEDSNHTKLEVCVRQLLFTRGLRILCLAIRASTKLCKFFTIHKAVMVLSPSLSSVTNSWASNQVFRWLRDSRISFKKPRSTIIPGTSVSTSLKMEFITTSGTLCFLAMRF